MTCISRQDNHDDWAATEPLYLRRSYVSHDRWQSRQQQQPNSSVTILQMVEIEREIIDTVRSRQKRWLGHILRHDSLLRIMLQGQIQRKKVHRRPRTMFLDWLLKTEKGNISYEELKISAQDRLRWSQWRRKPATWHNTAVVWTTLGSDREEMNKLADIAIITDTRATHAVATATTHQRTLFTNVDVINGPVSCCNCCFWCRAAHFLPPAKLRLTIHASTSRDEQEAQLSQRSCTMLRVQ